MEEFRDILQRLSSHGWTSIFDLLGIDPGSDTLRDDLLKLDKISAAQLELVPGFGDLAPDAGQPIKAGDPARSILFHALSSPGVVSGPNGEELDDYPTSAELEAAENFIYGIMPPTLSSILTNVGNAACLGVVVFAREYRQASKTVHGKHADMVYSRTGIARVGTETAYWHGPSRAYLPRAEGDDAFAFRALPCRYGVYLAVQMKGDPTDFGPFKFNRAIDVESQMELPSAFQQSTEADSDLDFWVPVHKLFSGTNCLLGSDLSVSLFSQHVNEKLRRIHIENMGEPDLGFESGFKPPETDHAPFFVVDDLGDFLPSADHGFGCFSATVRPRFIEPTEINDRQIGAKVPSRPRNGLAPSFNIAAEGRAHPAPEWMHVRRLLKSDGGTDDLNTKKEVANIVREGRISNADNFTAGHYSDFTADGWVDASVSGVAGELCRMVPAYSIIAAPDFYPFVDQSVLVDWWRTQVPTKFQRNIWNRPPLTLADQRSAANINLRAFGADIRPENKTPTAIVGSKGSANTSQSHGSVFEVARVSYLPDAGAGIYQPGWDVSTDVTHDPKLGEDVLHLAAYGLGSPFPEDAKLCAALSAFWPGVAPDIARSAGRRVVAPMTDREIGLDGAPAWDGVPGPRRIRIKNDEYFETDNFEHVDYVNNSLDNLFTMIETMKVSQEDYQKRVLSTAYMYRLIGDLARLGDDLRPVYRAFRILSFGHGRTGNALVQSAEDSLGVQFDDQVCSFETVQVGSTAPIKNSGAPKRWLKREKISLTLYVVVGDRDQIFYKIDDGRWLPPELLVG